MFSRLLTGIVSVSYHTKCVLLSNQKCMTQPNLINFYLKEYSQELCCYPFAVNLDRCAGSCDTLDDLSNKVCIPNETKYLAELTNIGPQDFMRAIPSNISRKSPKDPI